MFLETNAETSTALLDKLSPELSTYRFMDTFDVAVKS